MKKRLCIVLTMGMVIMCIPFSLAAERNKKKPSSVSATVSFERAKQDEETKASQLLRAEEWVVYLSRLPDGQDKPQIDILTFSSGNVFTSKNLASKGYRSAAYSLTPGNDGTSAWESLGEHTDGSLAFWHGELKGRLMHGVVSIQQKNAATEDFYFTTEASDIKR
ncbi:MAG: hypothetical protein A2Y00_06440 [Omnitrophica WOR_2 bacterium GWF2_43_52]|nr:MAG: hypothetical protein A2Y00_06440 [Omnitrophica WOR_2 bacterium GWF2_43_52]HAH20717.1 hypothetical protein [Candidatus Omnitrophota bacterium]HBG64824.1 hypothetical protein [Candidatus Omnitrophota bacterium]